VSVSLPVFYIFFLNNQRTWFFVLFVARLGFPFHQRASTAFAI